MCDSTKIKWYLLNTFEPELHRFAFLYGAKYLKYVAWHKLDFYGLSFPHLS